MYEGGMHQFKPWEAPSQAEQDVEMEAIWNKMMVPMLADALKRVMATGINGGAQVRLALLISKGFKPLDEQDMRSADASEAAMEAARMVLKKAGYEQA